MFHFNHEQPTPALEPSIQTKKLQKPEQRAQNQHETSNQNSKDNNIKDSHTRNNTFHRIYRKGEDKGNSHVKNLRLKEESLQLQVPFSFSSFFPFLFLLFSSFLSLSPLSFLSSFSFLLSNGYMNVSKSESVCVEV